jgi:hypothetical protein
MVLHNDKKQQPRDGICDGIICIAFKRRMLQLADWEAKGQAAEAALHQIRVFQGHHRHAHEPEGG